MPRLMPITRRDLLSKSPDKQDGLCHVLTTPNGMKVCYHPVNDYFSFGGRKFATEFFETFYMLKECDVGTAYSLTLEENGAITLHKITPAPQITIDHLSNNIDLINMLNANEIQHLYEEHKKNLDDAQMTFRNREKVLRFWWLYFMVIGGFFLWRVLVPAIEQHWSWLHGWLY